MVRYILQRLLLIPVLLVIFSIMVFALVQAPPGDYLTTYIATLSASGSSMDQAQVDALGHLLQDRARDIQRRRVATNR